MLISTILSVVLFLGILAYVMYNAKSVQIFPATISDCPDYYDINSDNLCVMNTNVWSGVPDGCGSIDFKKGTFASGNNTLSYTTPGKSASSGICAKKLKAQSCGITWDGITNNTSIC